MDLEKIKKIVNDETLSDSLREKHIYHILANDEEAIGSILMILQQERMLKKELITDMNMELSRAHIFIDSMNPAWLAKREKQTLELPESCDKNFIIDQIAKFYVKYHGKIRHVFNRFN